MELEGANAGEAVIIPEEALIHLAKRLKGGGIKEADGQLPEKQLETTLRAVIRTAGCTQISESHAATACDTLRACLTQCQNSDHSDLVALAYSQEIWTEIFDIFLRSSESRNSKPLKLLLLALERNLIRNPSQVIKDDLIAHIISKTWQVISLNDNGESAVKPSLQALRHFICKKVIRAQDIILIVSRDWEPKVAEEAGLRGAQDPLLPLDSLATNVAPITGRLIGVFCSSLRAWSSSWEESRGLMIDSHGDQPIWLSALKSSIEKQPELLDLFAIHVFPEIVQQDRDGIADFAKVISMRRLGVDNLTACGSADLHISLLLLRAIKEKGTFDTIDEKTVEAIVSSLLLHTDSRIRLLALSIAVQASAPKTSFSSTILSSLVLALPEYHAEIDPKTRQDSLALIKRFGARLTGTIGNFSKGEVDLVFTKLGSDENPLSVDASTAFKLEGPPLERHVAFFLWYRDFLLHELSPTASYQRHIVSLKVLESFISNGTSLSLCRKSNIISRGDIRSSYAPFRHDLLTSLLALVIDPFDDIRELATCILRNIWRAAWAGLTLEEVSESRSVSQVNAGNSVTADDLSFSAMDTAIHPGLNLACKRAAKRAQSTARADHADGFGRFYTLAVGLNTVPDQKTIWGGNDERALCQLMVQVDDRIRTARVDIHTAVKTASLHGLLIAARYLILNYNVHNPTHDLEPTQCRTWRDNIHRLLRIASDVWEAVKHILCADAPEGYEPDALDNQTPVGTKDMLSFCWRALKESSTLMHAMIAGSKGAPIIQNFQYEHYRTFGELAFTELAELRHRGAFSTVSQTFADCCVRCEESKDPEIQSLPKKWYQVRIQIQFLSPTDHQKRTLIFIQQHGSALTRRSAGLPAMITGILSATPKGTFFDTVIQDLQAIAGVETGIDSNNEHLDLPQVHAFNCLKDIFTDARFNTSVERHVSASLELAVHALESDRWAVRNCGLMLMKALITRMNDGTNTLSSKASSASRNSSSLVYDKFPNVPDLLLRLLTHKVAIDSESLHQGLATPDTLLTQAQHVFPALEIIEQSGIPRKYHTEILQASWGHLEGPVWAIRDKAAKALSYLPKNNAIDTEIKRCLRSAWSTQNSLHGRLLYLRYLIIRLQSDLEGLHTAFGEILEHFQAMILQNRCPITRSTYVALLVDILRRINTADQAQGLYSTTEKHKSRSLTPFKMPSKCSSNNWQLFTHYIHQECPENPAFALENAAKRRCRPLVGSFDETVESSSEEPDVSQTIFIDMGASGGPLHPEHADLMLHKTGRYLCIRSQGIAKSPPSFEDMIASWSRALQLAIDDHAEVSTRQAAVDSLADFFGRTQHLGLDTNEASGMLPLLLILYDTLLDDDEDVRLSAAATVSKLLASIPAQNGRQTLRIPLMVPAASHQLLQFLESRYRNSPAFWTYAVQRMIGIQCDFQESPRFPSPRTLLNQLKPEDTTLFVEEKQNLYIDEAKEAGIWLGVLLAIKSTAIETKTLRNLEIWAIEGIDALIEVASAEFDGPLGWTWKPEVYTLGMRILHAAQALVQFARDESTGVDGKVLRVRLENLLELGEKSCINGAWMRIIRKSLE
ncbi:MAG: hypothetical protein Q9168_003325 [Polycauliona sp. 1 TL-2023]